MSGWLLLIAAVVLEVIGAIFMKFSDGMTRVLPSVMMLVFYALSLGAMALATPLTGVSVAYVFNTGVGMALVAAIGIFWFGETATPLRLALILIIIAAAAGLHATGDGGGGGAE